MKTITSFRGMKGFLLLWGSQSLSTFGSSMTSYALILWVYQQKGTASSLTLLSFFTYLPSILFCFFAGTLADGWNKKTIMLVSDTVAALGTLTVCFLYGTGALQVWHLYAVNFFISLMNAFQSPASYVAVSLLAPKEQYHRVGGLQTFSGSLITVLTPAFSTALLAFGGLSTVLALDLVTFTVAFTTLLCFIRLPQGGKPDVAANHASEGFWRSCQTGLRYLVKNRAILGIILFFTLINFFAYLTGFGMLPALILARSGGNQAVLGTVSSSIGLGTLLGSITVTLLPAPKSRTRVIFLACGVSFALCNIPWAISLSPAVWVLAALVGNFPLPFLNANLTTIMRTKVPLAMQGRVFAARDTIQFCTIPLGLLLGGILADRMFEPLMAGNTWFQRLVSPLVGTGKGAGIAFLFLCTGVLGTVVSFWTMKRKGLNGLDE